jgi:hypothetical protein
MEKKKYFYSVKFSHAEFCGTSWDSGRFVTRNSAKKLEQTDLASRERNRTDILGPPKTGHPESKRPEQDSHSRTATTGREEQD